MIRYADLNTRASVRQMWKTVFGDDDAYMDIYFREKYADTFDKLIDKAERKTGSFAANVAIRLHILRSGNLCRVFIGSFHVARSTQKRVYGKAFAGEFRRDAQTKYPNDHSRSSGRMAAEVLR